MKWYKIVLLVFVLLLWWFFPTRSVLLAGKFHWIDKANLQAEIEPHLSDGFFRLSLAELQKSIMLVDGVEAVDLWRCWPGDIVVKLKARQPVLRWQKDGLVDKFGVLFYSSYKVQGVDDLPQLLVPIAQISNAVDLFFAVKPLMHNKYKIKALHFSPLDGWRLDCSNGLYVVLGQTKMFSRLKKFLRFAPKVKRKFRHKAILVDLRYTRGFAVSAQ